MSFLMADSLVVSDLTKDIAQQWSSNPYYGRAEEDDWLAPFWADESPFRAMFVTLDVSHLVELACGHGRHTAWILADSSLPKPNRLTLLDVNKTNVDHCRKRFAGDARVGIFLNNGVDFSPVKTGSASAVFCYDAMVHFEFDCVVSYIRDAARVLKDNGRAIFHHSNYTNPGSNWVLNPHGRNFMTRELFAHVALRSGFQVIQQVVMDWGEGESRVGKLDCLTMIEKIPQGEARPSLPRRVFRRLRRTWRGRSN